MRLGGGALMMLGRRALQDRPYCDDRMALVFYFAGSTESAIIK